MDLFHRNKNLAPGISRAHLKGTLERDVPQKAYDALVASLVQEGALRAQGDILARADFEPTPTPRQEKALTFLRDEMEKGGFSPPSLREAGGRMALSPEELEAAAAYLVEKGVLVKVAEDIYLSRDRYEEALQILRDIFREEGKATLAALRDALKTSRKYAQALLEYLDQQKITRREGDFRYPRNL